MEKYGVPGMAHPEIGIHHNIAQPQQPHSPLPVHPTPSVHSQHTHNGSTHTPVSHTNAGVHHTSTGNHHGGNHTNHHGPHPHAGHHGHHAHHSHKK